jgi:hypothetical protein
MLPTGYNILNGGVAADLSTIFEPLNGGTMYATPTGFIQYSTGKDLRELFAVNTSYTIPYNTNWIAQNGLDLRYIFQGIEPPLVVTITGTGVYTENITGNKRTYTFTSGTNTIRVNKNISSFNAIVVGGGGPGRNGATGGNGGGGGGGGFGYVSFSYVSDTIYNISVAGVVTASQAGQSTTFLNSNTGQGVTATGGGLGAGFNSSRAASGIVSNNGQGTFISRTGGTGGNFSNSDGENSSGPISVLGVSYNYGGGGESATTIGSTSFGGRAGANGVGGSGTTTTGAGASATTPGSGGGGGAKSAGTRGTGGPGRVVIIFTYP